MNIFNIAVFGIMLIISAILAVLANISISQAERQTRLIAVIAVSVLTFFAAIFALSDSLGIVGIYFLAFIGVWPLLIAFFINQKAIEQPVGASKSNLSLLGAAFAMILMTFMFMIPNQISFPEGKPIIDSEYLVSRISFLLATVPATVWYVLITIKKTIFHKSGIFHEGLLWTWSDFSSYQWKSNNPEKREVVLSLYTSLWLNRRLKLKIASDQKDVINELLSKEIRESLQEAHAS